MITKYLYLIGALASLPLFMHAYITRPDLRKRMVIIGILVGVVGVICEKFFFADYCPPPLLFRFGSYGGPEDFIFGFVSGGWGSVVFEAYTKRHHRRGARRRLWILPMII